MWHGGNRREPELLYSAYKSSLLLAKENNCHSIGFPLISSGIFGYPKDAAWKKAFEACKDFMEEYPEYKIKIVFAVINDAAYELGNRVLLSMQ